MKKLDKIGRKGLLISFGLMILWLISLLIAMPFIKIDPQKLPRPFEVTIYTILLIMVASITCMVIANWKDVKAEIKTFIN